jgi:hypothetical protein
VRKSLHLPLLLAGLTLAGCASRPAAVDQPDLKTIIDNTPYLATDDLGPGSTSVDPPAAGGHSWALNPDGKSWDLLLWYRENYKRQTRVYIVDFGTMKVTRQDFPEAEGRVRVEIAFGWAGAMAKDGSIRGMVDANGTLYGATPDTGTNSINIYRYDSAANHIDLIKAVPDLGGEVTPVTISPDGWFYGGGTWIGKGDTWHRAGAYGFNPTTGEIRQFGPVGPRITGIGYPYSMGCDDAYLYIACGQIPWHLMSMNLATGEQVELDNAPEGSAAVRMGITPHYGGAEVFVQKGDDAPRQHYWLYHGKMIPKAAGELPPWGQLKRSFPAAPPQPELYLENTYPDDSGHATLWWRPAGSGGDWQPIALEGVKKHALVIHRMVRLEDGRIWGTAPGGRGRFLFDPKTGSLSNLGDAGMSIYAIASANGKLYWSGYPSGPIYEYDPNVPWTPDRGGPPGTTKFDYLAAGNNPHLVHRDYFEPHNKTRVKKMLSAVVGADGAVYFGGRGQRDYEGGGLAWYDPATGKVEGLWKPFADYPIGFITTAVHKRYIIASSAATKVLVFDTQTHQVIGDFEPVPGARRGGPLLEVAEGRMLGITEDPENRTAGIIYGVEVPSGRVLFRKHVPYGLQFTWDQGTDPTDFQKGPDGAIWTYLGNTLVRINPADARVDVLGKAYVLGTMCFADNDLYVTHTTRARRYTNIVKRAADLAAACKAAAKSAPAGGQAATQPAQSDAASVQPVRIELEADLATLTPPMGIAADDTITSKYIAAGQDEEGMAVFAFKTHAAGSYVVWAHVMCPDEASDSFYVVMDNGNQDIFDAGEHVHNRWVWLPVNGRGSGGPLTLDPRIFPLSAGKHRLILRGREAGARLDRLVITNDRAWKPE